MNARKQKNWENCVDFDQPTFCPIGLKKFFEVSVSLINELISLMYMTRLWLFKLSVVPYSVVMDDKHGVHSQFIMH